MFNAEKGEDGNSWIQEVKDNLIYPYIPSFKMSIDIEFEKALVEKSYDITGTRYLLNIEDQEKFFIIGDYQKNYFP